MLPCIAHRSILPRFTAGAVAVLSAVIAPLSSGQSRATPIRHAGTYHVLTGTWTRPAGVSIDGLTEGLAGLDTIYSNTAVSGYYLAFNATGSSNAGGTTYDEGGLPGTTNPDHGMHPAARDEYCIKGFQIGYCDTNSAGTSGWELSFYDRYSLPFHHVTPNTTITVTNLPANGCWTVDIDLSGGLEFSMGADGGAAFPGWDGDPDEDRFSWSLHYAGSDGSNPAGFLISGHPNATDSSWTAPGELPLDATGTIFHPQLACAPGQPGYGSTGYLGRDQVYIEEPLTGGIFGQNFGSTLGTYIAANDCSGGVGNQPFASFHMELYSDGSSCPGPTIHGQHCSSTINSTGETGQLQVFGSAQPSEDRVELRASRLPTQAVGFFITSQTPGSVVFPGGSVGRLCLAGEIGRFSGPGQVKSTGTGSTLSLDTEASEWTLSAIPTPTGTYAAMVGASTYFQLWHRDVENSVPVSNFSNGARVNWQ